MKRRIRQTIWGNWNGYIGTRRAIEFGTDEMAAKAWLRDPAEYERDYKLLPHWVGVPGGVKMLKLS